MKKYILSATLALAASTSALAGKENSHDLDFYIGKTFLYSQENFNSEIQGRELYEDTDQEVVSGEKEENQIKTQGTITTPLVWNFADLDYKVGGKFFFAIGPGFSVGLEISSINPLNFAFEGLTESKYTVSADPVNAMFNDTIFVYKKNPDVFISQDKNTAEILKLSGFADGEFLYGSISISDLKPSRRSPDFIEINEDFFTNLGFNEVKSVSGGKIIKLNNTEINIKNNEQEFLQLENKIKDLIKNLHIQYYFYGLIELFDNDLIKDVETTKVIKTAFISPSIRYDINLNENFDFNISAKFSYGLLSITEKSCMRINIRNDGLDSFFTSFLKNIEDYTSAVILKQDGLTVGGGLESSLKYNMSDEFSAGINFSINAYGNVPKSFDSILYKTDDVTKTDIATLQYEKASPEETDQSCFGLIDATISVGATIKL